MEENEMYEIIGLISYFMKIPIRMIRTWKTSEIYEQFAMIGVMNKKYKTTNEVNNGEI